MVVTQRTQLSLFEVEECFQKSNITEPWSLNILLICQSWCAFQVEGIQCAEPGSYVCQLLIETMRNLISTWGLGGRAMKIRLAMEIRDKEWSVMCTKQIDLDSARVPYLNPKRAFILSFFSEIEHNPYHSRGIRERLIHCIQWML